MSENRTQWFREARWGVFAHYLAAPASSMDPVTMTPERWNEQVESFDAARLGADLADIGTQYFFITIGQNTGFFCSPNETYDSLVGRDPSRLSRRDLVADIADELEARGIRTLAYVPAHAPAHDRMAVERLACTPPWDASAWQLGPGTYRIEGDIDERLSRFQIHWEAIVREWSLRWGRRIHGWWVDGCYHADRMYRASDQPNFESFADAMRAGNPQSIVAFNPGVKVPVICYTPYEDYTAGEVSASLPIDTNPWEPENVQLVDGFVQQAQYHLLTYMGEAWGRGEPRFSEEFVRSFTQLVNIQSGVVSWDVPIDGQGRIPDAFRRILSRIDL